jgi:hypothetical protein
MSTLASDGTDRKILLILLNEDCRKAIAAAFEYAKSNLKPLDVIQILSSDLYHYGHQDLVATRSSKRQFLLHIRDEVLQRGRAEAQALEAAAYEMGLSLRIETIESEDIYAASLAETQKGYEIIFVPKQEIRVFPLFKKTLAAYLQKKASGRIISC